MAARQVNAPGSGAKSVFPQAGAQFQAGDHVLGSSGAAAVLTITADATRPIVLRQIHCGYDATPAAGCTIEVKDGTTIVWKQPIVAAGPNQFNFDPPRYGTTNTAMVITLSAPGGSILGYLDVNAYTET